MKYIMRCVNEVLEKCAVSKEPTEFAEDEYTNWVHDEMAKTVWATG
jgi:hypothetical protein